MASSLRPKPLIMFPPTGLFLRESSSFSPESYARGTRKQEATRRMAF